MDYDRIKNNKKLIVLNDDFNTFDHVIKTLIKICNHFILDMLFFNNLLKIIYLNLSIF